MGFTQNSTLTTENSIKGVLHVHSVFSDGEEPLDRVVVTLHERGKFSGYQEVWSLLVFECWHKQFIRELVPSHAFRQATIEVDAYA